MISGAHLSYFFGRDWIGQAEELPAVAGTAVAEKSGA